MENSRIYAIAFFSVSTMMLLYYIKKQQQEFNSDFRGIIQNVSKDGNNVNVSIKDKIYQLDLGSDFEKQIQNGDYLIKRKGVSYCQIVLMRAKWN